MIIVEKIDRKKLKTGYTTGTSAAAAAKAGYQSVSVNMRPLYDHSYYFISTFMRDHVDFHARALLCKPGHL